MRRVIDRYVGERVRFFRISSGMKQKELARRLGISSQQVQKYEAGKDKVSISRLAEIGEILGFSLPAFWDGFYAPRNIPHNRQALTLMKHFREIPDERTRQALVDVARFIAERTRTKTR